MNPNFKAQSETLENYMDYDFNGSGKINSDFKRKTLTKPQWDIIRKIGAIKLYFLIALFLTCYLLCNSYQFNY